MKQILFILLFAPLALFGQQDSITYKKLKNGGSTTVTIDLVMSSVFTLDSGYYKIKYSKIGESVVITIDPFTDIDSLIGNVLFGEYTDASRQYKQAILASESQEKGYELRLRQAEKQYLEFTGEPIKDKVKDVFDVSLLIGDWLLNKTPIKITEKLEINKEPIKILSDQQFIFVVNGEKILMNRIKDDLWESKGGKFILSKLKVKQKKQ